MLPDSPSRRLALWVLKTNLDITHAFQELEWKQRSRLQHALNNPGDSPYRVDRSMTVIERNRYGNVQPWDAARVKLQTPIGGSDYINASPISLRSRVSKTVSGSDTPDPSEVDEPIAESRYIATQGPKDGQFSHFWNMVMQETVGPVGVIVMLTQLSEGNKEKCSQYFPSDMDNPTILLGSQEGVVSQKTVDGAGAGIQNQAVEDGDPFTDPKLLSADADPRPEPKISPNETAEDDSTSHRIDQDVSEMKRQVDTSADLVTLKSFHHDPHLACEVRQMTLTIGSEKKEIYHYLFTGWPDFGKPEAESRRALLELLRVSKDKAGGPKSENPRFVHCSAGVGRTGTFIALDFLIGEIEAGRIGASLSPRSSTSLSNGSNGNGNNAAAANTTSGTWGRSGPTKQKELTPDTPPRGTAEKGDLVYETVNSLREQRMMMVMNELQFAFLYEVLREVFEEWSARGRLVERGVGIRSGIEDDAAATLRRPVAKVPRIEVEDDDGKQQTQRQGEGEGDVSVSEAETEIMGDDVDRERDEEIGLTGERKGVESNSDPKVCMTGGEKKEGKEGAGTAKEGAGTAQGGSEMTVQADPYAVVAPESIRQGTEKSQSDSQTRTQQE